MTLPNRINDGTIFRIAQRLKKAEIPFTGYEITKMDDGEYYALFNAAQWAVKKAMHPFEGCNPDFALWDSKIRGSAKIGFKIM